MNLAGSEKSDCSDERSHDDDVSDSESVLQSAYYQGRPSKTKHEGPEDHSQVGASISELQLDVQEEVAETKKGGPVTQPKAETSGRGNNPSVVNPPDRLHHVRALK